MWNNGLARCEEFKVRAGSVVALATPPVHTVWEWERGGSSGAGLRKRGAATLSRTRNRCISCLTARRLRPNSTAGPARARHIIVPKQGRKPVHKIGSNKVNYKPIGTKKTDQDQIPYIRTLPRAERSTSGGVPTTLSPSRVKKTDPRSPRVGGGSPDQGGEARAKGRNAPRNVDRIHSPFRTKGVLRAEIKAGRGISTKSAFNLKRKGHLGQRNAICKECNMSIFTPALYRPGQPVRASRDRAIYNRPSRAESKYNLERRGKASGKGKSEQSYIHQ